MNLHNKIMMSRHLDSRLDIYQDKSMPIWKKMKLISIIAEWNVSGET